MFTRRLIQLLDNRGWGVAYAYVREDLDELGELSGMKLNSLSSSC